LVVPLFPRGLHESSARHPEPTAGRIRLATLTSGAALALTAQAVYFVAPGAAWGYLERIGQTFGLTLAQVGTALGLSTFAGMAGALLVVLVGTRVRRWPAMLIGSGISMLALVLLLEGSGLPRFLLAAALFNFAWNATFPYQMGVLASLDRDGSVAVLSLLMQVGGLALGPMLGSMLHPEEGYAQLLYACVGCYAVSLLLFHIAGRARG
jgi:predicted MFS family arabinose efflux permease